MKKVAYFTKIGHLAINRYKDLNKFQKNNNYTKNKFFKEDNLEENIINCLKESSEVMECEEIKIYKKDRSITSRNLSEKRVFTFLKNPIWIKFDSKHIKEDKKIEAMNENKIILPKYFYVIIDGTNFLYYRAYTPKEQYFMEGAWVRDFLANILKKRFEIILQGPTPLRENFIFHTGKMKKDKLNKTIELKKQINPKEFFPYILSSESFHLGQFYNGTFICEKMLNIEMDFNSKFNDTFNLIKVIESKNYRIFERNSIFKKIKYNLIQLNFLIGKYIGLQQELRENKKRVINFLEGSLFNRVKEELLKEYNSEKLDYDNLLKTFPVIRNFIEDFQQNKILRWTITSSIIAAIIGAIMTYWLMGA